MGKAPAYAYKTGQRPYGQPAGEGFIDSTPRPNGVSQSRNIHQVSPVDPAPAVPVDTLCSSLTRSGAPCKGRPVTGSDLCVFHTSKE